MPEYEEKVCLRTIVYTIVSYSKQKDDLERLAERMVNFCLCNGWQVDSVIKEIASGLNDKRPKLVKILKLNYPIRIVAEHKDRLTRFGYNYLSTLINGEIVIANLSGTDKYDLVWDLISIITRMDSRFKFFFKKLEPRIGIMDKYVEG